MAELSGGAVAQSRVFMVKLCVVPFTVVILVASCFAQASKQSAAVWIPATYRALTMGKSTDRDALHVLGQPLFTGREPDTGAPIMTFAVSDPLPGQLITYLPLPKALRRVLL